MHRRSVVAAALGAGASSLAGCAGFLGGDRNEDGGDDGSGGGDGSIESTTRWAVPVEGSADALAGYDLRCLEPAAVLEANDAITSAAVGERMATRSFVQRQLDVRDVDRFVEAEPVGHPSIDAYAVFEGSFSHDAVTEGLRATQSVDVEHVGSHRGYDLYESGAGFAMHAVADGTVVEADQLRNEDLELDAIESVIDAATGASDRITDLHEDVQATADRLVQSHHVGLRIEDPTASTNLGRSQIEGQVASGMDAEVNGDSMTMRTIVTFESKRAREAAPIEEWIGDERDDEQIEELSSSIDGRYVTLDARLRTSSLYG